MSASDEVRNAACLLGGRRRHVHVTLTHINNGCFLFFIFVVVVRQFI